MSLRDNPGSTPRAPFEPEPVTRPLFRENLAAPVVCICELVGGVFFSDPQACGEGFVAEFLFPPTDHLERADESGGPEELLLGEKPVGVSRDDVGSRSGSGGESAVESDRCSDSEIGLCLSASGREPDEVDEITVRVPGIDARREIGRAACRERV